MKKYKAFDPQHMPLFERTEKVGLLATLSPQGLPHVSLITTLQAKTPERLIWGEFTKGLSKEYVRTNPKVGWLIMTMDRKLWRGTADYDHAETEGPDYVMFNNKPMFRYNTYFGINTVHHMNLRETYGQESLPLPSIVPAALLTKLAKSAAATGISDEILRPWARGVFDDIGNPKFLCYAAVDGYPTIVPLVQCQAADSRRLAFSPLAYGTELKAVPAGAQVAVFGMTYKAEDVLVRGRFNGYQRRRGIKLGTLDIDWVYNSMPPKHGQIYPLLPLEPVREF